ncbi:Biotin carboxyl carrier protein of acetyl-CoA carboxylase [Thalassoglobus neptunius]|uniref:Biotin carboxyl carrier protein of acetyl-CoA carboxylase n=1 Tax=Thalassoglobus neptunius TaxID=1938619 RepID=A0A5C5WMU4_9PLAN|nr:acetyl-CoA carboxylase biotin carboxyl carrier protein [Thalassoglobus neptunius]TWT51948.1 Biotin carboxyl carrier protein of acetyl-CoA carboxylase [Thalassoglobus neptunius]
MARDANAEADELNIDGLRQVMELMEKHDVTELKLEQGTAKYVLRRGGHEFSATLPAPAPVLPAQAVPVAPAAAPPAASDSAPAAAPAADEGVVEIKSPTVGTFYQSPSPGEPVFVKVGDHVTKDSIVCIVEAMKVFNQIPAEVSGTIVKVLLKDSDSVEYGQPLFLVKPD